MAYDHSRCRTEILVITNAIFLKNLSAKRFGLRQKKKKGWPPMNMSILHGSVTEYDCRSFGGSRLIGHMRRGIWLAWSHCARIWEVEFEGFLFTNSSVHPVYAAFAKYYPKAKDFRVRYAAITLGMQCNPSWASCLHGNKSHQKHGNASQPNMHHAIRHTLDQTVNVHDHWWVRLWHLSSMYL